MTTTEDYIENMPTKSANLFVWAVTVLFVIVLAGFLLIKQPDVVTGNIRLIAWLCFWEKENIPTSTKH